MENFEQMYFLLFNAITDAVYALSEKNYGEATNILISAQQKSEEMYIDE